MGWSVSADARRELYGEHTTLRADAAGPPDGHVEVMIDGNAKGRSLAVGTRRAAAVARQILECVGSQTQQCVICFDNDNIPDVRKREVHKARAERASSAAKRIPAATADEIEAFTGMGEVEWERLFATGAGKRVALLALCRALKEEIIRRADASSGCRYTLTLPTATDRAFAEAVWSYPFGEPSKFRGVLCETRYGEAEAQVIACIRHSMTVSDPPPATVIHTIDTDVYLQCLSFVHPHLSVVIGVVWQTSDGAEHSSAARARTASAALRAAKRQKTESSKPVSTVDRRYKHVSLSAFARSAFDADPVRMVNAQWWFLLSGGCDYNFTGLAGFGWNHKTCLGLRSELVIVGTTLHLGRFVAALRGSRNARRRNGDVAEFCDMLVRTVYCWHYYQWTGPQPELAQFAGLFEAGGVATVTDWLGGVPPDVTRALTPSVV